MTSEEFLMELLNGRVDKLEKEIKKIDKILARKKVLQLERSNILETIDNIKEGNIKSSMDIR